MIEYHFTGSQAYFCQEGPDYFLNLFLSFDIKNLNNLESHLFSIYYSIRKMEIYRRIYFGEDESALISTTYFGKNSITTHVENS